MKKRKVTISRAFIRWLLVVVAVAFLLSMLVAYIFQTNTLQNHAYLLLQTHATDVKNDIEEKDVDICVAANNRHVGRTGYVVVADQDGTIISDRMKEEGASLAEAGIRINRNTMPEGEMFTAEIHGEACYCLYIMSEGYYIVTVLPEDTILSERNVSMLTMGIVEIVFFAGLFFVLFLLFRSQEAIVAEASRMDEELAISKRIQESALPTEFPPFPERKELAIFASMETAREVGGDFYDYYFLENGELAFLIADVSGKGIPAAMGMMKAKTILRDYAEQGEAPTWIFEHVNNKLCEGNKSGMFLTAWMGFLNINTGLVRFINAGHNAPVRIRDGKAAFVEQSPDLVLAMMEEMKYTEQTVELLPGDILYLYTDGVTEASKADESRLGNKRLLEILSGDYGTGEEACRLICKAVKEEVDIFAEGAEQFDDITQVCLYYRGV